MTYKPVSFQAVVFDLFNTLVYFDYSRLPEVEWQGRIIRTTCWKIHEDLRRHYSVSFTCQALMAEFFDSYRVIREKRGEEFREIPSAERFEIIGRNLGISDPAAVRLMVEAHMGEMYRTMHVPEDSFRVLNELRGVPLVLASNFDHGPTARRALRTFGLERYFQAIYISDEVGWRKPGRRFFRILIEGSGLVPERCLYVGDDPCADVMGASEAGFQVAWLPGPDCEPPARPDYRWSLQSLPEVLEIYRGRPMEE
jgi:FMN phosphatase YigB (HAD superfamily)